MKKHIIVWLLLASLTALPGCGPEEEPDTEKTVETKPADPKQQTEAEHDETKPVEADSPETEPELTETLKPVIYLYPESDTDVTVQLDYAGELTCTYPTYRDGWTVTAAPDGTLTDASGMEYSYLYWEGTTDAAYDFSTGFCVPGEDTAAFLEDALAALGLNRREANEFIIYWLPMMEENPYNLISFQSEAYTDIAPLTVTPAPDTMIRVFMAWQPMEESVEIAPQELTAPERDGFVLVEWGGSRVG